MRRRDLLSSSVAAALSWPVQRTALFHARGGAGPTGPTLDMSFLSGTLDPAITFTRAAGPATYFNNAGTIQTAGTNVPRFDYDPVSLQMRGLLIEEARTNVCINSQAINSWATKTDTTVTDNNLASPDGTVNASRCVEGVAGSSLLASSTGTVASGATVVGSAFVKRSNCDWIRFIVGGDSVALTNGAHVWVNINTGATGTVAARGTGTAPSASIQNVGNGWYRVILTCTLPAGTTTAAIGACSAAADASNSRVNSAQYYLWGGQCEAGAFATSYIPTTTAAATRPADLASITIGGAAWFNVRVGTLYVEYDTSRPSGAFVPGGFSDGTFSNTCYFSQNNFNPIIATVGHSASSGAVSYGGVINKQIGSWDAAAAAPTCLNAATVGTSSALGANPAWTTNLGIGSSPWSLGGNSLNGHMRGMRYWPRALGATELQTETGTPSLDISLMAAPLDSRLTFTRASTATYFDVNGVMQTAASGAPRYDFDPVTHVSLGLLIEEQRQNAWLQSGDISQASGNASPNDCARIANQGIVPDGTNAATKCVPSTGAGTHIVYRSFTGATSITYVWSVFLKPAGYSQVQLALANTGFAANISANFDIQNGVVLSNGAAVLASGIAPVGNGWYRCWIAGTSLASAGTYVANFTPYSGTLSFAGDGTSGVLAWGGQVEVANTAQPFPTSYIATAAAAVTRPFDSLVSVPGPWLNASAGTMAGDFMITNRAAIGAGNAPVIWELDNGAVNDAIALRLANVAAAEIRVFNASASTGAAAAANSWTQGAAQKLAGTYTATALTAALNGGAVASGANTALPSISRMFIGTGRTQSLSGYVRRVRYWPRVLSNAELQQVTT